MPRKGGERPRLLGEEEALDRRGSMIGRLESFAFHIFTARVIGTVKEMKERKEGRSGYYLRHKRPPHQLSTIFSLSFPKYAAQIAFHKLAVRE